jgi:predicted SnoaL-like aldol condensation-catalyzing enzyme
VLRATIGQPCRSPQSKRREFYDLMFSHSRPAKAVDRFVATATRNTILSSRMVTGVHRVFRAHGPRIPRQAVEFRRVLVDGPYVVLHCYQHWPGDGDWAGIDIFRLDENGRIVEHWMCCSECQPRSGAARSCGRASGGLSLRLRAWSTPFFIRSGRRSRSRDMRSKREGVVR